MNGWIGTCGDFREHYVEISLHLELNWFNSIANNLVLYYPIEWQVLKTLK